MRNCLQFYKQTIAAGCICLCTTISGLATTYTGVVKDSKSNTPVQGVRVSLGYTSFVTFTDNDGKFILSDEVKTIKNNSIYSSEFFEMSWSGNNYQFNLANASSINTIRMYSLNGTCVFKKLNIKNQVFQIPSLSKGIYLIQLISNNGSYCTYKINTSVNSKLFARLQNKGNKQFYSATAAGVNEPLLFKHDSYYPVTVKGQSPETPVSISMKQDPRAYAFNEQKVHTYKFTMTTSDSLKMEKEALLENFVPAQFSFDDSSYGQIGIRYKGSVYSLPNCFDSNGERADKPVCKKISFKLKFDKYTSDTRFYSMKKLNLHSMSADESKMHDILSYALFREMGIISPRCSYVKVYINGVFQGIFVAVEDPDGRFTDSRWPDDPDGNLYKEKWPITDNENYYKAGLVTNDNPEDSAKIRKMVSFYNAIDKSTSADFIDSASKFIDLNYFLRYIAVDRAIHNADGVMTWYNTNGWLGNHNYFMYEETSTNGKVWIVPWDLHVTMSKTDPIVDDLGVPEWNVKPESCAPVKIWGNSDGIPAHCDKLTGMIADLLWNKYVTFCEGMLKSEFSVDHLTGKIDFFKQLIDTMIIHDPYVDYAKWSNNVKYLRKDVVSLNNSYDDYIHKRSSVFDTSDFLKPFTGNGSLQVDQLNNFEFTPAASVPDWIVAYYSTNSTATFAHNATAPLWGVADMKYSFSYRPAPGSGMYQEWSKGIISFGKSVDLSNVKEICVNMKSDIKRVCTITLESSQYSINETNARYSWIQGISEKDSILVFKIAEVDYPYWETSNPPDILNKVLSSVSGIGFSPNPRFDNSGELAAVPDSGYVQIDNIRFVY